MSLNTHHSLRHTSQSRSFPASGGSTLPVKDEPCVLKLRLGRRKALTRYSVPDEPLEPEKADDASEPLMNWKIG
jgi:hypothetical protein